MQPGTTTLFMNKITCEQQLTLTANSKGRNMKKILDFIKEEEGATMPEYGLMAVLIAATCVFAVTALGENVNGLFEYVVAEYP